MDQSGQKTGFLPDPKNYWDMSKVEACYVLKQNDWYYMFYMGVHGDYKSAVGLARSADGINWERHPDNPVIAGDDDLWDFGGICKVSVVREIMVYAYGIMHPTAAENKLAWHIMKDLPCFRMKRKYTCRNGRKIPVKKVNSVITITDLHYWINNS